jgi:radical SAM protein with 4Fe4S-binding SPASM domain
MPHASIKQYDKDLYLFDAADFELYGIPSQASELLIKSIAPSDIDGLNNDEITFINDCLSKGLMFFTDDDKHPSHCCSSQNVIDAPLYLLIHTTDKCNLQCKHCYLGNNKSRELPFESIATAVRQFSELAGLTVLVSGGEPLLHPDFKKINKLVNNFPLRFELLTNGTLFSKEIIRELQFHEVQISLDGWEDSHDKLRGHGSFAKSISAIRLLLDHGTSVSVATMITDYNTTDDNDFNKLEQFCLFHAISNWSVTSPCKVGEWTKNAEYAMAKARRAIQVTSRFGYGEGQHDFGMKYSCGANLCTIMPNGSIIGCVLMPDVKYGHIADGIEPAWSRRNPVRLVETECRDCIHVEICRGGCRVSAKESSGSLYGKDQLQCAAIDAYLTEQNKRR